MHIKLLQLNMWAGTHMSAIETFLTENDFDILCLQEIAGPKSNCSNFHSNEDQFEKLQQLLHNRYLGEMAIAMRFTSDPIHSFDANAIFYKKDFTLLEKDTLTLTQGIDPFPSEWTTFEQQGRNALHVSLQKDNQIIDIINAHLAWAPTHIEQPYQLEQNKKLVAYIGNLHRPFILAGDFNIDSMQPTILALEKYARNLTKEYHVKNTLDPINHRAWEDIKPGFPVDYIFVSPDIQVENFQVLDTVHLSDHFGLTATVEV